ncbi:CDP-alcohol phosphatidyltransferase family protein [Micromonospora sp. DT227]|uniref:CDP-alcohol phosphatidyltransferase family protein n=1 Tax=Micromonospora sp. DT227 TaxID=3393433 RepID=UPI003CF345BE
MTAVRLVVCLALAIPAFVRSGAPLTLAAIIAYSAGDVADGQTARRLRQETRRGAVFDIVADRVSGVAVILALTAVRPSMAVPLLPFLVQFDVLGCILSLRFLHWPIRSINYFYLVHLGVYRWNWSPMAMAVNTAILVLLVAFVPSPACATVFVIAVIMVKVGSLRALHRLAATSSEVSAAARHPVRIIH